MEKLNPLTLKHAIENKMSIPDLIRYFKPDATDEDVDFILWEQTCYPFDTESMVKQLNVIFKDKIHE